MLKFLEFVNQYLGNPYDNTPAMETFIKDLELEKQSYADLIEQIFSNQNDISRYTEAVNTLIQKKAVLDLKIDILTKIKRRI